MLRRYWGLSGRPPGVRVSCSLLRKSCPLRSVIGLTSMLARSATTSPPARLPCMGRNPQEASRASIRKTERYLNNNIYNPVGHDNNFSHFFTVDGLNDIGQRQRRLFY